MSAPLVYEINTRVWVRRFDAPDKRATLDDVPDTEWERLAALGFNYVWLMGVWETVEKTIEKYALTPELEAEYRRALKDYDRRDVVGSPFAVADYDAREDLGGDAALARLRERMRGYGLKLLLDFIPNHFSAESDLLYSEPEIFLQGTDEDLDEDPDTFFRPEANPDKIFAHGRDPFFPAWTDTAQVNYFSEPARRAMIERLGSLAERCDGVRCDMAMLALTNVFNNTWRGVAIRDGRAKPDEEFWTRAIRETRAKREDFLFVAEAYWDMEWSLMKTGFDFVYDKRLYDRLRHERARPIRDHLNADEAYSKRCVRFIENHDEARAANALGFDRSQAAAVIIATIEGMRLFHDGQFEGRRIKLPLQLGREPDENEHPPLKAFYERLFELANDETFHVGDFRVLRPEPAGPHDDTFHNLVAYERASRDKTRVVVVNYSGVTSRCRLKLELPGFEEELQLVDLLQRKSYRRSAKEIRTEGLFVRLGAWRAHVFAF
ncbi:MAG: glycosidase [Ignavibacteriales bacterium]|nr:glycosidase [Ignavibacteriales bacterium]